MDMSPSYLPTSFVQLKSFEFEPLTYKPIDTGMLSTHQFDPILKTGNMYQSLGICGQAHQSIIFNFIKEPFFQYSILPYPLYFKNQSDLYFYKLQTTYSRVAYTLSFPKENEIFAVFAKNIKGVTVAANINASVNEGTFVNQSTKNLCGDILIHYQIPSSIFGFRASYIINHLNNSENGGLLDSKTYQERTSQNNAGYEIRTAKANSKITTHDFALQSYVNLINKQKKYFGTFTYDFQFNQNTLLYYDQFDSIYQYYQNFDSTKVINDSTRFITCRNMLQWSNFSPYQIFTDKNRFFYIAGGVMHDYADIKSTDTTFNSFSFFARTHIRLFKLLNIKASMVYSFFGYSKNDIVASAEIGCTIN